MKKTFAIAYSTLAIIVLLGTMAYLVWEASKIRVVRMSDLTVRTKEYTRLLTESLVNGRDINTEVALAKQLLYEDPLLIAVQVFSRDDGLRLSVVKPIAEEFTSKPIAHSEKYDSILGFRYQIVDQPMIASGMTGISAYFIGINLTSNEIRRDLLILLVITGSLLFITLALIIFQPNAPKPGIQTPEDIDDTGLSADSADMEDMENFEDLDDGGLSEEVMFVDPHKELLEQLEIELAQSESFNQDVSLILFTSNGEINKSITESYSPNNLVFPLESGRVGVIETNKSLDMAIRTVKSYISSMKERAENQEYRIGITSRNNRNINASNLFNEADKALLKTDGTNMIVAFRSDPDKYNDYVMGVL